MRRGLLSVAALVAFFGTSVSFAAVPSFRGLGAWPGSDDVVWPRAISADGKTIVGPVPGQQKSFRWTADGGLEELAIPGADPVFGRFLASDVSPDGRFAYGGTSSRIRGVGNSIARIDDDGAVTTVLEMPETGPSFNLADFKANDDGTAFAIAVRTDDGDVAAHWSAAGLQLIGDVAGGVVDSRPMGISADGSVIVGIGNDAGGDRAFRWNADDGLQLLDGTGGSSYIASAASAVSADGSVIVGKAKFGLDGLDQFAMRWTEAGGVELLTVRGETAPLHGWAFDVSADGERIVGHSVELGPFIWTKTTGALSLDSLLRDRYGLGDEMEGWQLGGADIISADGMTIASIFGYHPDGPPSAAWVATIPEPSSAVLLMLGGSLVACRYHTQKRRKEQANGTTTR